MQLPDEDYLFGRVVLANPPQEEAPGPSTYLIYVYRDRHRDRTIVWDRLRPDQLLLPPIWINRLAWTKGYVEPLANRPISAEDLLQQHCFRRWNGTYLNEKGQEIPSRVEPCGDWGLASYRWLDDQISDALGLERVPD